MLFPRRPLLHFLLITSALFTSAKNVFVVEEEPLFLASDLVQDSAEYLDYVDAEALVFPVVGKRDDKHVKYDGKIRLMKMP